MYKQQRKKPTLVNRQTGLLLVLFLASILFAISLYQISNRSNWITSRFASYQGAFLLPGNLNIEWAYILTVIEFILLLTTFYFLLTEINKRKKINNELMMLTEHYCTVIEYIDVNENKKREESMLKAVERCEILAKATSDTIWDWDIISDKIFYNATITKMFGYQIAEIENVVDWWKQNIHPEDLGMISTSLSDVFENRSETIQLEYRFRCTDGSYKDIYDRAFVIYDGNQKAVRMIGSMQDVTYKKNEEKGITKAILNAREQERSRIGLELHDNVNQILASTQLTLGMAKDKLIDRERMIEFIDIGKSYITNAIDELRKLSHELVPASFDDNNLRSVFGNLLLDVNLNNQFDIYFHFDEVIHDVVSEDIQINLYRIVQEQAKNIVNYSGASKIEIELTLDGDTVRMRTFDNGCGFNTKHIKNGIGLSNMKKRVDSFSGKFFLNSSPGKGCEIIIEIPAEPGTLAN